VASKPAARWWAWGICIVTVIFASLVTADSSFLVRMVAIVSLQLLSMKIIVVVESYPGKMKLNPMQWLAFSLGWFGMRPALFETFPAPSQRLPYATTALRGLSRIGIGLLLVYVSAVIEEANGALKLLADLALLVGISFILHFGILNLSTAYWRWWGVNVKELFRSPYKSRSLNEFWGKRWNMAFSEMTTLIAYRPLKFKIGKTQAMMISFLLSGLLHEIAISLPVKAGYGLPMLYFALHGLLMYAEQKSAVVQKIITNKILSHVWVLCWLILPLHLLFHPAFMEGVLKPLRSLLLHYIS
jgi:alginate O-acetyltransferase complex protein AlgI